MGCICSKSPTKKISDSEENEKPIKELSLRKQGSQKKEKEPSLRKQLSQNKLSKEPIQKEPIQKKLSKKLSQEASQKEPSQKKLSKKLSKEQSLAKQSSLQKESSEQEEKISLKSEKSKDEASAVPSTTPPTEEKEVEVTTREDGNIIINENFDWNAPDTRSKSEKKEEFPKTPTPSLRRKDPVIEMRGRRLSDSNIATIQAGSGKYNTTGRGSSMRKIINRAFNRHSMSQSMDVTSVTEKEKRTSVPTPLIPSQISEDEDEPLTKQMMLEWKTPNVGFERLLATNAGRKLFDNFLAKEYSRENLQFWIACEKLKSITEEKKFSDHVDVIFKIYIDPSALDEISLEGPVKSSLRKKKLNPTRDIFEEAQTKIYSLMHRDSFPRFLISKDYKDALLQFGPITPDSPSSYVEFPRSSELGRKLTEATKSLLENVQTPETDDQQQESFDTDQGQPGEVEKCITSGGADEQKKIENGLISV